MPSKFLDGWFGDVRSFIVVVAIAADFVRDLLMGTMASSKRVIYASLVAVLASLSLVSVAVAVTTEETDYRTKNVSADADISVDSVDPYSGSLTVKHTDLFLPGNGGMDIAINRIYSLAQLSAGFTATYIQSHNWIPLGPGWSMRVAPRLVHENTFDVVYDKVSYGASPFKQLCEGVGFLWSTTSGPFYSTYYLPAMELPSGERFTLYSSGGYEARAENNWRVRCDAGIISARSPDGVIYEFGDLSSARKIGTYIINSIPPIGMGIPPDRSVTYLDAIKATDRNGNWLTFQYQAAGGSLISPWEMPGSFSTNSAPPGRLKTNKGSVPSGVVSSDGRSIAFVYDGVTGRLQSIADNAGRSVRYDYIDLDVVTRVLSKVTRPDGTSWDYSYHPGKLSVQNYSKKIPPDERTDLRLATLKYPRGGVVSFEYDYYDQQQTLYAPVQNSVTYWRGERVVKRALSTGDTWQYSYVKGSAGQLDVTTVIGPDGQTTYRYMGAGFNRTTTFSSGVFQNNAWQVGKLIEKTFPNGSQEQYVWTQREVEPYHVTLYELGIVADQKVWTADLQRRTVIRDGAAYTTVFSGFDAYGNPGLVVENGPSGESRTTAFTYLNDTAKWIIGRRKDEVVTGGSVTARSFDANGNLNSITRDGVTTSYTYDSQGNVASKTLPRGLVYTYSNYKFGIPQTENQPEGINITRVVNNAGNVTSETNGEGRTTSYTYDGLNRVTSVTYPRGNPKTIVYTPTSQTATRGSLVELINYDGFGQAIKSTLGGIATSYSYDALGRKIFDSNPDSATLGTSYQYDALGRMTRMTNADGTYKTIAYGVGTKIVTDERGLVTTHIYRSYGDPDQQWLMGITAADSAANVSIVRRADDLVSSVTQAGLTRTFDYDSRKYLTSETNPETGTITYGRDAAGNMTSRTVAGVVASFTYDGQNRLVGTAYSDGTPSVAHVYSKTSKLKSVTSSLASRNLDYDFNDNLISEALSAGGVQMTSRYSYTDNDQLSAITYPISDRVINFSPDQLGRPTQVSGYVNSVSYWPSGMMERINYANGHTTEYAQHSRLWPSGFFSRKGSNQYVASYYGYDGNGNVTSIVDGLDATFDRALGYDALNRLTTAAGPWGNGSIAYDAAGNILSQSLGSFSLNYSYSAQNNRLNGVSGSRSTSYSYDGYGNVVAAAGLTYAYDAVPNLRCANCTTSNRTDYSYDGLGKRVSVSKAGVTTYEFYASSGNLLAEYTPAQNSKLVEYIYLGGKRVAQRVTDTKPAPAMSPESLTVAVNNSGGAVLKVNVGGTSPTGTVSFSENGVLLGVAQVSDGQAIIELLGLSLGTHTIVATYSGDGTNASNTVTFTINVANLSWLPAVLDLLLG